MADMDSPRARPIYKRAGMQPAASGHWQRRPLPRLSRYPTRTPLAAPGMPLTRRRPAPGRSGLLKAVQVEV
jgi:hypothetical protein